MGGGLMQVVAIGKQDAYLSGNPQFTYFKTIYRRHTNFATESIMVHWDSNTETPDFGSQISATIPKQGDLVSGIWLQITMPYQANTTATWIDGVGNGLIKRADIEIGGHLIDRHYGEWMNIWSELSTPQGKLNGYDKMVGNNATLSASTSPGQKLDVPLMFWFCRNPGLALPLVALQNQEVKLKIELEARDNLLDVSTGYTNTNGPSMSLWVDYVFLDSDERRRFAQVSHEYLIEQLQRNEFTVGTNETSLKRCELWYDYPIKELNWVIHNPSDKLFDFDNSFSQAKLELDSRMITGNRIPEYFLQIENYTHHQRVPRYNSITGSTTRKQQIYTYSFALNPENHQPSGATNFTRIDTAVLTINGLTATHTVNVYATNYNLLRFMTGSANLSFSI